MLDVVLQILSVLGIILLGLLGLLLAVILLVLFCPITYRIFGENEGKDLSLNAKANWLFGLIRVRYVYPDPGKLTVKALWFTVFDSDEAEDDQEQHGARRKNTSEFETGGKTQAESGEKKIKEQEEVKGQDAARDEEEPVEIPNTENFSESKDSKEEEKQSDPKKKFRISEKIEKIKYTFRGIYDKIKKIWQNINYYVELLQDRETRLLFLHVKSRVWKILKSIRPRKLKAQILFGTGSPDTTGYAYGIYGMLLPLLGPDVLVTPDFCQAVFKGSFYAAGHITIVVLLWHAIRVLMDKRLRQFRDRLKTRRPG